MENFFFGAVWEFCILSWRLNSSTVVGKLYFTDVCGSIGHASVRFDPETGFKQNMTLEKTVNNGVITVARAGFTTQ